MKPKRAIHNAQLCMLAAIDYLRGIKAPPAQVEIYVMLLDMTLKTSVDLSREALAQCPEDSEEPELN